MQADGRRICVLKVLLEKCREMRELVSGIVCAASEQSNVLEVRVAALDEAWERGTDEWPSS